VPDPPTFPEPARHALLAWYAANGRSLAFRQTTDPWAILVSEVIAQQTQAARAAERWGRFLARFPTARALADATPADVLREWQGLGYDRRGLRLRLAAQRIVAEHDGRVPSTVSDLERLPGIGPYTARAVAAIAFGQAVGAVDTNVRRVLGRVVAGGSASLDRRELQMLADDAVPTGRAAAWTHAVMDLGATICRPRSPRCDACPVRAWCRFAATGATAEPTRPRDRTPFLETTRWLRGRILDRLRDVPDRRWVVIEGAIGDHDEHRVSAAIESMAADGLLEWERSPGGRAIRARLPV
jgi:A/G-specific adenine glycosylase